MKGARLVLLAFIFLSQTGRAQYIFTSLQTKDGLWGKEVLCVFKDSEGFIWFGTGRGLNRFDGSGFKVYNHSSIKYIGLSNQAVYAVTEYGKNKIWVGTREGLFCFDKGRESFDTIKFFNEKNILLQPPGIMNLLADQKQQLWIATLKGLFLYKNNRAVLASTIYPGVSKMNDQVVPHACLKEDRSRNGIWAGSLKGLFFINYVSGVVMSAWNNPRHLTVFDSTWIQSFTISKAGNIWFSGAGHGLGYYDFQTNRISDITHVNGDSTWNLRSGCNALFIDSKDRLWISNWLGKIFVKEPDRKKFAILPDESPSPYKLGAGSFFDMYEDEKQNLWIGSADGASKLSASGFLKNIIELPANIVDPTAADAGINSTVKAGKDSIWICKDDALYLMNVKTGSKERYFIPGGGIRVNRFFDMQLINGEWWCGTGDGLKILDMRAKRFNRFPWYAKGYEIKDRSVFWIHKDRKGIVWFSSWNDGVYRHDPVTKITTRVTELSDRGEGADLSVNSLCMLEDHSGKLWLSNGAKGIRLYDYKTNRFTKPGTNSRSTKAMEDVIVQSFAEDKDQHIWLATTHHGILKLDNAGNIIDSVVMEAGTGRAGITALLIDKYGKIWITTTEGVYYINPVTKGVSKLNVDVGPPFHDPIGSIMSEGEWLYASSINKLAVIDLPEIEKLSSPLPPVITGVSVFEKEIPFTTNSSLQLKYNENFFVIEFSSPDHREIASLQYAYRLKGFDKDWVYCGRRQAAAYTNVPNGQYTFQVKCTDGDGQWMEKETTISIVIAPPFWKTWWFITGLLLLAIFIGWKIYLYRSHWKQKKNVEKTIDYFANSVYGENSVNEICWDIARNCISQLNFEDCVVYLTNEEGKRLVQKAAYGPKNPKGHEIDNPLEIETGKGIVGTVAQTGKPLLIPDTTKDARYIVDDEKRLSELCVPILHDGKVIGVIDSEHPQKNFFTEHHLKTLTTIASISAHKIAEAQAEENAKQHEIKLLAINKMLAESQLMALRAQMNPHFVFNCLNSIQECIVTQKYGEASNYLNKFSKLFRTVLNNSGKNLVTVNEEMEGMKLYLELELMRFDKSFSYKINVDPELETDEILMPSMLVQPYVENALWHGLMHKEGERKLQVDFIKVSEDVFRCVIDDNGIGRKRSFELKEQQSKTKRHESQGLKITKDRIDILKQQGYHASLEIIDKTDKAGNAGGTTVVIELSTFLKM